MQLQRYFDRIGYDGMAKADFTTLAALHEAHVCSVSFENLDVPEIAARHQEVFGDG